MKNSCVRIVMVFIIAGLLPGLFIMPLVSAGKRGQCPECQEECLRIHTEKMHTLDERYKKTGDRLDYQNDVDRLILEYRTCLDNCREPYPVK